MVRRRHHTEGVVNLRVFLHRARGLGGADLDPVEAGAVVARTDLDPGGIAAFPNWIPDDGAAFGIVAGHVPLPQVARLEAAAPEHGGPGGAGLGPPQGCEQNGDRSFQIHQRTPSWDDRGRCRGCQFASRVGGDPSRQIKNARPRFLRDRALIWLVLAVTEPGSDASSDTSRARSRMRCSDSSLRAAARVFRCGGDTQRIHS